MMPTAMVATTIVPTSPHGVRAKKCRSAAAHRMTKGAMTSAPARSPSHQVIHVVARAVGAPPENTRLATATVALLIVLQTRTSANWPAPVVVANLAGPPHQALISHAATSASSV